MACQVAILAGGAGTRLKSRTGQFPKPMALINGVPVLEHQIILCRTYGFTRIALLLHHQAWIIRDYFGDGNKFDVELVYVVEREARGTAGALLDALKFMEDRFLTLYADTYADINLKAFWNYDNRQKSVGTLLLHPNDHPHDSDLVEIDNNGAIIRIHPYPHPKGADYQNLVNAGLYILDKKSLSSAIPLDCKTDLAKNIFPTLLRDGKKIYGYITPEYIKDMGTPERLDRVERDINEGLPEKLSGRKPRTAVFLDRDGTLNIEVNHLNSPSQLRLLSGVAEAVGKINTSGMLAVGITNQPVLARGGATMDDMKKIHARLDGLLGERGAYLDRIYVCPHHPEKGFPGEVLSLKMECNCRKPKTGLFDLAIQELNILPEKSWMIGDTTSDVLAGKLSGLRTILVRTGYAGRDFRYDVEPDFVAHDLADAVDWILHGYSDTTSKLMPLLLRASNSRLILVGGASRSGKSSVANVLSELLRMVGKSVHVLPLDAWLNIAEMRQEGFGVLTRYQLKDIIRLAEKITSNTEYFDIEMKKYDRKSRQFIGVKRVSIGSSDIVILEGVPALLNERLLELSDLSIYIEVDDILRINRLREEYLWREEYEEVFMKKIISREQDEVSLVKESASKADYKINF